MDKKIVFLILLISGLVVGCNPKTVEETPNPEEIPVHQTTSGLPQEGTSTKVASQHLSINLSPLEMAHKEYLFAYNEYVRLTRESGPQTMETLQALADYQKKYRIYQMILKASD
jgi:hypothetical protein